MQSQAVIFDYMIFAKFKLIILVLMKIQVVWNAFIFVLINGYGRGGGSFCLSSG
jgi:hypothetical protein